MFPFFSSVHEQVYFGKYPCVAVLNDLRSINIDIIIDLTTAEENLPKYSLDKATIIKQSILRKSIPSDDVANIIIGYIEMMVNKNHKIYLHCGKGHGRAYAMAALWVKYHYHFSTEAALIYTYKAHQQRLIMEAQYKDIDSALTPVQKKQISRINFNYEGC